MNLRSPRVLVALLALWLVSTHLAYAQSPSTLDDYRAAVTQTLMLVQQANALPASQRAPTLAQAATTLAAIQSVQLPSGSRVQVDNSALIALIREANQTPNAVARLTALQKSLAAPLPTLNSADLTTLAFLLSNPPFVAAPRSPLQELIDRINEAIQNLFNNVVSAPFNSPDLTILLAVLLAIAIIFYLVRALRRNLVSEQVLPDLKVEIEARTPTDALARAQQFANAGDYRSAVRQMYLATLLLLDQRGKLKYDPTLTNREYLREVSLDPDTSAALAPIVELFDRSWYGFQPVSQEEFEAYRRRVEAVKEL